MSLPETDSYRECCILLAARLIINEHYQQAAVKEIYDNVLQLLSENSVRLYLLQQEKMGDRNEEIEQIKRHLAIAIRDLRKLTKWLVPDKSSLDTLGLDNNLGKLLLRLYPETAVTVDIPDAFKKNLPADTSIVAVYTLLEIVRQIRENDGRKIHSVTVRVAHKGTNIIIVYEGCLLLHSSDDSNTNGGSRPSLHTCISFMHAQLLQSPLQKNKKQLTLVIPSK